MQQSKHLSDYRIDRYLLGLDSPEATQTLLTHLDTCSHCRSRVEQFRLQQQSYEVPTHLVKRVVEQSRRPSFWDNLQLSPVWFQWLGAASVASLVVLWVSGQWNTSFIDTRHKNTSKKHITASIPPQPRTNDALIVKGQGKPKLWVALRRGTVIRYARSGELFYPKDRIRLAFQWKTHTAQKRNISKKFVYLLHQDCKSVSPLYPNSTQQKSQAIRSNKRITLPGSFELDQNRSGSEMLWACFSQTPLSFQRISRTLPDCTQWNTGRLLVKEHTCTKWIAFKLKRGH